MGEAAEHPTRRSPTVGQAEWSVALNTAGEPWPNPRDLDRLHSPVTRWGALPPEAPTG